MQRPENRLLGKRQASLFHDLLPHLHKELIGIDARWTVGGAGLAHHTFADHFHKTVTQQEIAVNKLIDQIQFAPGREGFIIQYLMNGTELTAGTAANTFGLTPVPNDPAYFALFLLSSSLLPPHSFGFNRLPGSNLSFNCCHTAVSPAIAAPY